VLGYGMAKITLFGLAGTGTSSVGKTLAKKLGYTFMSTGNIFRAKAESLGLSLHEFEELCNKNPEHDKALDQDVKKFGEVNDNFVIESRLAWYFIPDSIKIKLHCDFPERIKRVAKRDAVTIDEAEKLTIARESFGVQRYNDFYNISDFAPDSLFDISIDTTTTPIEKVVERIMSYLENRVNISR
jgi:CMP/dCMP kinase